jgi:hypothetical protein
MSTKVKRPIFIGKWNPRREEWEVLSRFKNMEKAEHKIGYYCNLYPSAWIEIVDESVGNGY